MCKSLNQVLYIMLCGTHSSVNHISTPPSTNSPPCNRQHIAGLRASCCGHADNLAEAICDQDIEALNHRHLAPIWICTPTEAFLNTFRDKGHGLIICSPRTRGWGGRHGLEWAPLPQRVTPRGTPEEEAGSLTLE